MNQKEIIQAFSQLGKLMLSLGENEPWKDFSLGVNEGEYVALRDLLERQKSLNGWFTIENVHNSLKSLGETLVEKDLNKWCGVYNYSKEPKKIGIIMAGNIPLVGFHDMLCVMISGNKAVCKLSSDDKTLLPALGKQLLEFAPEMNSRLEFTQGHVKDMDGIIATGSDNSMKYFEQYFGNIKHVFRGNRTSVAVFNGNESKDDIADLGKDIFHYFGLGCRNVTHLIFPKGFNVDRFFEGIYPFHNVINNNKYANNYDYNKTIYLMNKMPIMDNNFVLLRESNELHSPLAMLHYHFYEDKAEIVQYLNENADNIQAIVGDGYLKFGSAQSPSLDDYADGVDVMRWLENV